MLIITRRVEQSVICELPDGKIITIKIVDLRGKQIRIGIKAPKGINILRDDATPEQIQKYRRHNSTQQTPNSQL